MDSTDPRYSWTAVLLYVYTGQIAFSPIDSQGATSKEIENDHSEDEVKPAQDREGPGTLPSSVVTVEPCSPKSVYRLADKVYPAPLVSDADTDKCFP